LPTPAQAALPEGPTTSAGPAQCVAGGNVDSSAKRYELPSSDKAVHIDDIVERSGLNSSDVLATLFAAGMHRIVCQKPGTAVS
jgi:predicted Rossmann fold nucleotide-binding protein DprA/Smf involved in DNA uptake